MSLIPERNAKSKPGLPESLTFCYGYPEKQKREVPAL
jgi:hypothetical protein